MIPHISNYVFDGKSFVLKKEYRTVKFVVVLGLFLMSVFPKMLGDSYQEYTPIKKVSVALDLPAKIASYVTKTNPRVSEDEAKEFGVAVVKYARRFGHDVRLLVAIAHHESTFDRNEISRTGALGLYQVIPRWHVDKIKTVRAELGSNDITGIEHNAYLGAWILKECKQRTKDVSAALQCYSGNTPGYSTNVLTKKNKVDQYI